MYSFNENRRGGRRVGAGRVRVPAVNRYQFRLMRERLMILRNLLRVICMVFGKGRVFVVTSANLIWIFCDTISLCSATNSYPITRISVWYVLKVQKNVKEHLFMMNWWSKFSLSGTNTCHRRLRYMHARYAESKFLTLSICHMLQIYWIFCW